MSEGEKNPFYLLSYCVEFYWILFLKQVPTPPKKSFFGLINLRNTGLLNPVFTTNLLKAFNTSIKDIVNLWDTLGCIFQTYLTIKLFLGTTCRTNLSSNMGNFSTQQKDEVVSWALRAA